MSARIAAIFVTSVLSSRFSRMYLNVFERGSRAIMGRREVQRKQQQTTKWYVHDYHNTDDPAVLPLGEDVLESLQFDGKRNYGYGEVQLKDIQMVDPDDLLALEDGEAFILELVTPFVLESEYPNAHDRDVPWWWKEDRRDLREREEKVLEQREVYKLQTVDHGQVVAYEGGRPVETAINGLLRVGSHSRYSFGERRMKPVGEVCQEQERNS